MRNIKKIKNAKTTGSGLASSDTNHPYYQLAWNAFSQKSWVDLSSQNSPMGSDNNGVPVPGDSVMTNIGGENNAVNDLGNSTVNGNQNSSKTFLCPPCRTKIG